MKRAHYNQKDGFTRVIGVLSFVLVENWILLGNYYWSDWRGFVLATLIMVLFTYPHWLINNAIARRFQRVYPHYWQVLRRQITNLLILSLTSCFFTSMAYGCFTLAGLPNYQPAPERLTGGLFFVVFIVFVVATIHEIVVIFEQWQQALLQTEQLRKANQQRQLESLKNQINPHFLFNSLNSLSSLLEEDPAQAEQFVDEMSSVYRYLLRSNATSLVTLATEMAFAQSYFHLLRTRYGEHIRLEMSVDARYHDRLMPSLTLQLLLENAVKHNVILAEQPLHIRIETVADRLVVRNNLQRKTTRILSNQVGLANIAAKYRLLDEGEVAVSDDDRYFTVTLPLVSSTDETGGLRVRGWQDHLPHRDRVVETVARHACVG